ncbi:hypothetical protein AABD41_01740 [Staphylococcus pseudoxylosus]|uniref:hypothetical protein n=1 Tax=Staphylococcus pseudoxylosus TaxID=2282419 RepID=UPI00398AFD41
MRIMLVMILIILILAILLYIPICRLYSYLSHKEKAKSIERAIVDEYKKEQIHRIKLDSKKKRLKNQINYKKETISVNEEINKLNHELKSFEK